MLTAYQTGAVRPDDRSESCVHNEAVIIARYSASATSSAVCAVCAYESAALVSRGRLPSITQLCRQYHWLAPVVVASLAWHFWAAIKLAETPVPT